MKFLRCLYGFFQNSETFARSCSEKEITQKFPKTSAGQNHWCRSFLAKFRHWVWNFPEKGLCHVCITGNFPFILMNTCPWQFNVFLLLLLDLNFFKQNYSLKRSTASTGKQSLRLFPFPKQFSENFCGFWGFVQSIFEADFWIIWK